MRVGHIRIPSSSSSLACPEAAGRARGALPVRPVFWRRRRRRLGASISADTTRRSTNFWRSRRSSALAVGSARPRASGTPVTRRRNPEQPPGNFHHVRQSIVDQGGQSIHFGRPRAHPTHGDFRDDRDGPPRAMMRLVPTLSLNHLLYYSEYLWGQQHLGSTGFPGTLMKGWLCQPSIIVR